VIVWIPVSQMHGIQHGLHHISGMISTSWRRVTSQMPTYLDIQTGLYWVTRRPVTNV